MKTERGRHIREAFRDTLDHVRTTDRMREGWGLLPAAEQDMTWGDRIHEIQIHAGLLDAWERDDLQQLSTYLDTISAAVLNAKIAVLIALETRIP